MASLFNHHVNTFEGTLLLTYKTSAFLKRFHTPCNNYQYQLSDFQTWVKWMWSDSVTSHWATTPVSS